MSTKELSIRKEELNLFTNMATRFAKAGAFPKQSPEQLFVLMKAGQEMGMSEVESLNSLYIVNGKIEPYGKAMVALIVKDGWELSYEDETDRQVTVVAKKGDRVIRETVNDSDQIIKKSRATSFSKKNKLRFHGIRTILNFHLAHLIVSTADLYEVDAINHRNGTIDVDHEEEKEEIDIVDVKEKLINIHDQKSLETYYKELNATYQMTKEVDDAFQERAKEIAKPVQHKPETEPQRGPNIGEQMEESIKQQIKACTSTQELNALYKELNGQYELGGYLKMFSERKKEISK